MIEFAGLCIGVGILIEVYNRTDPKLVESISVLFKEKKKDFFLIRFFIPLAQEES